MNHIEKSLQAELARREARGFKPTTISRIKRELGLLGFRIDRTRDARGWTRIMTGDGAGEGYPNITTGIKEIDTGRSVFHYESRRDDNFQRLQEIRRNTELFAVVHHKKFGPAILDL